MNENEIIKKLRGIVINRMPEIADEEFDKDTVLKRDLGLDSMNFIALIIEVEQGFGIHIPEGVWTEIVTVGDAVNIISDLIKGQENAEV